jgi:uncharacterized oligopeptide transporter (OPT) family protein
LIVLNNSLGIGEITPEHPHALQAPQATLMSTIIKGMLSNSLPWGLVLIGMGISAVVELCGVSSLAFAVGAYLPLSSTTPIFAGGVVKWLVDRKNKNKAEESEVGPGALFSSGLIAGGALTGILIAILIGTTTKDAAGNDVSILSLFNTGIAETMQYGSLISLICFVLLALILYRFATAKQKEA